MTYRLNFVVYLNSFSASLCIILNRTCEAGMMCGIVENRVPEWRASVAVCKDSRKRRLLDISVQLFWRFLRDNSLGRPENCRNLNEILILWGLKYKGVFL